MPQCGSHYGAQGRADAANPEDEDACAGRASSHPSLTRVCIAVGIEPIAGKPLRSSNAQRLRTRRDLFGEDLEPMARFPEMHAGRQTGAHRGEIACSRVRQAARMLSPIEVLVLRRLLELPR